MDQQLFEDIELRKQNIKIRNHLPATLPDQIYHITGSGPIKLPTGEYWYSKKVNKTEKR